MISKRIPGFNPQINGFQFPNMFADAPVLTIPVPPFGAIPVGDAAGGMSPFWPRSQWAARSST